MLNADFPKYNKYSRLDLRFKLKNIPLIYPGRGPEALGSPFYLLLVL